MIVHAQCCCLITKPVVLVPETEIRALSLQSLRAGNLFIGQHILSHQISEVNDYTSFSLKQMQTVLKIYERRPPLRSNMTKCKYKMFVHKGSCNHSVRVQLPASVLCLGACFLSVVLCVNNQWEHKLLKAGYMGGLLTSAMFSLRDKLERKWLTFDTSGCERNNIINQYIGSINIPVWWGNNTAAKVRSHQNVMKHANEEIKIWNHKLFRINKAAGEFETEPLAFFHRVYFLST